MADPLTIGLAASGGAVAIVAAVVALARKKPPLSQTALVPPPLKRTPEEEADLLAARVVEAAAIDALVIKAAQQQWVHETSHRVKFDPKQRQLAAVQRAARLFHEARIPPPHDLAQRIREALTTMKDAGHA